MSDTPAAPTAADRLADWLNAHAYDSEELVRLLALLDAALAEARSTPAEALREALEHVLDVWAAPSPEEFARLHRVLTGHDSCSPHNREADHE